MSTPDDDHLQVSDVNAVLTFADEQGREWLCAGILGELVRYEDGQIVETVQQQETVDRSFLLTNLKIVLKP